MHDDIFPIDDARCKLGLVLYLHQTKSLLLCEGKQDYTNQDCNLSLITERKSDYKYEVKLNMHMTMKQKVEHVVGTSNIR